jgi:hypothetical protein
MSTVMCAMCKVSTMIYALCKIMVRRNSIRFGAFRSASIFSTLLSCEMNVIDKCACKGMARGCFDSFLLFSTLGHFLFFRHLAHGIVPLSSRLLCYLIKNSTILFIFIFRRPCPIATVFPQHEIKICLDFIS